MVSLEGVPEPPHSGAREIARTGVSWTRLGELDRRFGARWTGGFVWENFGWAFLWSAAGAGILFGLPLFLLFAAGFMRGLVPGPVRAQTLSLALPWIVHASASFEIGAVLWPLSGLATQRLVRGLGGPPRGKIATLSIAATLALHVVIARWAEAAGLIRVDGP